jgi:hypothetical protein
VLQQRLGGPDGVGDPPAPEPTAPG